MTEDFTGLKFNRWLVLSFQGKPNTKVLWLCKCDCGTEAIKNIYTLKNGGSKSCGCLRREVTSQRNKGTGWKRITHGMTGTPEWSAFKDARHRCTYPSNPRWKDYGGRGIKFLFRNFQEFFDDIGPRPNSDYSLDRKENSGNYEIGNVKWSTDTEQAANRRQTSKDLTGLRFGRLVVLSIYERLGKRNSPIRWLCQCDCGKTHVSTLNNLKYNTRSCGCLRREVTSIRFSKKKDIEQDYPEPITR